MPFVFSQKTLCPHHFVCWPSVPDFRVTECWSSQCVPVPPHPSFSWFHSLPTLLHVGHPYNSGVDNGWLVLIDSMAPP